MHSDFLEFGLDFPVAEYLLLMKHLVRSHMHKIMQITMWVGKQFKDTI